MKYVVVDLEMCTVPKEKRKRDYPHTYEIIQIGAVLLNDDYEIIDQFMTHIQPQYGFMSPYIENLTGIKHKELLNAPSIEKGFDVFLDWIPDNASFVQWSVTDKSQIKKEIEIKDLIIDKINKLNGNWIDCQEEFGKIIHSEDPYSLEEALYISGVDYKTNFHDGLVDAYNTALLLKKMRLEKPFRFNKYYMNSKKPQEHLGTSLKDVLKMKVLEIA